MEIIFKRSQAKIKKPKHLEKNVFVVYSPRGDKIEPATSTKIDTEIIVSLPKNSKVFITSIFRGDEINEFSSNQQRLWVEILNKSYEESLEIKKNNPLASLSSKLNISNSNMRRRKTEKPLIIKNVAIQTENAKGTWRFS